MREINLNLFRKVVAPDYAHRSDEDIQLFATEAQNELDEEAFGDLFPRALCLITAHLIFVSDRKPEIVGVVDSARVGQLENRWSNSDRLDQDPGYVISKYGREFLRLRKQAVVSPFITDAATFTVLDYY